MRPAAYLWAAPGITSPQRRGPSGPCAGCERMRRGHQGFGSRRSGGRTHPFLPRGARAQTLNPETRLPHRHPLSTTSAPGSGVRKSASSRAPLRTGSGGSASTSSIRSATGSSWRRLRGSGWPSPGLGAPPPTGCMPRGPPGGGGAGAHRASAPTRLPERRAEWAAPPSGPRCSLRPALAPPGKAKLLQLPCPLPSPGTLRTSKVPPTHSLWGRDQSTSVF